MATTNIGALLLAELQTLSTEARRKHPEIKEAAERVIVVLRGIKASGSVEIAAELAKSDEAISPFVLGCKTNNHKLASISVQCLQQLISHRAVSPRSIAQTLNTLNEVIHLGVDIQVKTLQMVLPLVTMYDSVYGETLVDAFHLCLALQKSRDPIVNNTAAAILRQVVVAVFDRVVIEDREHNDEQEDTRESDMTRKYAKDAFFVLQDLCLWAAGSDTIFILDETVDQGLVLDLIESVLVNHAAVVARHTSMLQILRERLAPFVVGFFAEKAPFTLAVRCIRIVWLFIRDLHVDLAPECEMFLSILTRLVDPNITSKGGRSSVSLSRSGGMQPSKTVLGSGFPLFYRVLAMEILRNTLRDAQLLHQLYAQFDGDSNADTDAEDCHVIADVLKAVGKVAAERPELRVSNSDGIPGAHITGGLANEGGESSDSKQVGAHNCSLRTEMHKLLDKHEPPLMPEPYLAYLAFTALLGVADGLAEHVLPLCSQNVPCSAPSTNLAPGSVLSSSLALTDTRVQTAKQLLLRSWPVLLSVYTFYLVVRLDDLLFGQIMDTMQKLVQVSGAFELNEARDGFLLLLCRSCLPQAAIADHERQLQQGHRALSVDELEDGAEPKVHALPLVTTSLAGVTFSMNTRQIECLRAVVACAQYLASVLGPMWYPVLVTLQQAEELLYQSHGRSQSGPANAGAAKTGSQPAGRRASVSGQSVLAVASDDTKVSSSSDLARIRTDYARLLGFVRSCGRDAIMWTVRALCVLGTDLSNAPSDAELQSEEAAMRATASIIHRRLSAVLNRPTFAIDQLRAFAVSNVDVLVGATGADDQGAWRASTRHLLATATHSLAPAPMRTQACSAVSDIVLAAMDLVSQADSGSDTVSQQFIDSVSLGEAQVRVLTPLLQMMNGTAGDGYASGARFVDVSKLTLDTLHMLLQSSGRSIMRAWSVVFDIIRTVLDTPQATGAAGTESRQPGYLMRCVFPCLQLVCSDYLEDLPPHCLRRCIECLALFGRQNEDLNIALTAIGQAWAVCDFLQGLQTTVSGGNVELVSTVLAASSKDTEAIEEIARVWWHEDLANVESHATQQVLWILLLHSLAQLGCDRRHEVRLGAIQTLFRTLDMRGSAFDAWLWDAVVWAVVLPLSRYTLVQRSHIFNLIRDNRLDELLEDAQDEAARMASKSGVFVEDPGRLFAKQWDETAATALQGAARVWAEPRAALDSIGCAAQAWQCMWRLVQALFVGEPAHSVCKCRPDPQCSLDVQVGDEFVMSLVAAESAESAEQNESDGSDGSDQWSESVAGQCAQLRTRESMSAAIDCASSLITSNHLTSETKWRIAYRTWLSMGALATLVPARAPCSFNEDNNKTVVVTHDALCVYLRQSSTIANTTWLTEADAHALLHVARLVLMHVEVVQHSADDCKMTNVQEQVLEVARLVVARGVDSATAMAQAAENLAMLVVLPYVVCASRVLDTADVVRMASRAFAPMTRRLDVLYTLNSELSERKHSRRAVRPSFVALSAGALDCLGEVLSDLPSDDHREQILRSGVWKHAIVAMGMHVVAPLAPTSDWFVRVVPSGMLQLHSLSQPMHDALKDAWNAVGCVLALAMCIPQNMLGEGYDCSCSERCGSEDTQGLSVRVQIRILDAVVAASLEYVGAEQPGEIAEYWAVLVRILEWGAVVAMEPVVVLSTSGTNAQELTMACFGWLFRMSSVSLDSASSVSAVPLWVSAAAAPALVRRSAMALDAFTADTKLLGLSPLPQSRIVLARLVLESLAQLQCHPRALTNLPHSPASHIRALYPNLVALISVNDSSILRLVQQCLFRVSAEILG
ncbi:Endocytosis and vacuole integrity protein [Coemansia sp. RSA 1972]|nr:Endocytosis and vacuole integrity protein [Coemansia sp. RSA 1972]